MWGTQVIVCAAIALIAFPPQGCTARPVHRAPPPYVPPVTTEAPPLVVAPGTPGVEVAGPEGIEEDLPEPEPPQPATPALVDECEEAVDKRVEADQVANAEIAKITCEPIKPPALNAECRAKFTVGASMDTDGMMDTCMEAGSAENFENDLGERCAAFVDEFVAGKLEEIPVMVEAQCDEELGRFPPNVTTAMGPIGARMFMANCVSDSLKEIESFLEAEMEHIKGEGLAKCQMVGLEQFKVYVAHMDEVDDPDNEATHPEPEPGYIGRYAKMPWMRWGHSKHSKFTFGTLTMLFGSVAGFALLFVPAYAVWVRRQGAATTGQGVELIQQDHADIEVPE